MKKIMIAALCAVVACAGLVGCTKENVELSANTAGQLVAASWIAAAKPVPEVTSEVVKLVDVIDGAAANASTGTSYSAAIYPIVMDYLAEAELDPAYVPLVIASSLSLLNGIDTLFLLNPEWKEKQDKALGVVQAFLEGAKFVFSLQPDSRELQSIIKQADELDSRQKAALEKVIQTSVVPCGHGTLCACGGGNIG